MDFGDGSPRSRSEERENDENSGENPENPMNSCERNHQDNKGENPELPMCSSEREKNDSTGESPGKNPMSFSERGNEEKEEILEISNESTSEISSSRLAVDEGPENLSERENDHTLGESAENPINSSEGDKEEKEGEESPKTPKNFSGRKEETNGSNSVINHGPEKKVGVETSVNSTGSHVGESMGSDDNLERERGNSIENTGKETGSPLDRSDVKTKGAGLRKWRRIKREVAKDGDSSQDLHRVLKRDFSIVEQIKAGSVKVLSHEEKVKSEGSIGSANSTLGLNLAPGKAIFVAGSDSDNSEDRSSKSSTAASVSKSKPSMKEFSSKFISKEKLKTPIRTMGSNPQRTSLQRKDLVDASKKLRADRAGSKSGKIEKEKANIDNHHVEEEGSSSVESDLRSLFGVGASASSNSLYKSGSFSALSNGRWVEMERNLWSLNYGEENASYEHQSGEGSQMIHEGHGGSQSKENGGEIDCELRESEKEECVGGSEGHSNGQHLPQINPDSLEQSLIQLQAAQEALEKEIEKVGEIGKEANSQPSSSGVESGSSELNQRIILLGHKLKQASATIEAKDVKVQELEALLNATGSSKNPTGNSFRPNSPENQMGSNLDRDMELELELLFEEKMRAEIEYLMMKKTTQKLEKSVLDSLSLLEEKESLIAEQALVVAKLKEKEVQAFGLEKKAKKLEASCNELLEREEVLKLQCKVCKLGVCCFSQLFLLCVAFAVFISQLLPQYQGTVPT
ncbi:WPP domain-interacting protein 2 [Amborella trichopoda]|nr:WPP domain-interacting protein 2 [Amborella trichopoda]XP_011628216.1 WPP domain-interacting protein 2 [Amborella trichopoda]|eukprot:XP_011628215.1 WPP domain-interacting protein 2 [Amborella trichopoda]